MLPHLSSASFLSQVQLASLLIKGETKEAGAAFKLANPLAIRAAIAYTHSCGRGQQEKGTTPGDEPSSMRAHYTHLT
jgi:hypothetical protein